MPQQNYLDELTPAFTPLLAIKEASRCLLCHDAPCSQACPAQTDPGKFIRSIYFRNFKGAAETIRENNALGAVCARVCPTEKLCQSGCTRAGVDAPIDIGRLQRFVTDFEQQTGMEIYQPGTKTLGKVAIIGAGPAGLQASVTLTNQGYDVTIYEKEAHPGGWLRNGIPQFRLPQSVLDAEIARIEKMGVTIKCNNEIGKTLTLEQLKAENRAVLVTVGLSSGSGLPLFEHSDVEIAVDFLLRARQAQGDISIPQSALIIGGGDVAMDVASTLKVLGCQGFDSLQEMVGLANNNIVPAEDLDRSYIVYPRINLDKCVGCGRCYISCYDGGHQAMEWSEKTRTPHCNTEKCVGCLLCGHVCPVGCIELGEVKFKKGEKEHPVTL
ncbi:FAD-dependent oxidoreductase [Escherichia coli]|nr:FAD-dependent oxidoreductase [Escherichia coli]EGD0883986.1 FAD-dependent oxidoreductase [Escherichia coli]EHB5560689.1 FAD-dependent oxidoreductase [Escherichia coli]EJI3938624.1 FAD-dependent oxidoreductase [Escherichia coli]EJL1102737.1 FAD-dependent oxidoreductase [Escherichia coli]